MQSAAAPRGQLTGVGTLLAEPGVNACAEQTRRVFFNLVQSLRDDMVSLTVRGASAYAPAAHAQQREYPHAASCEARGTSLGVSGRVYGNVKRAGWSVTSCRRACYILGYAESCHHAEVLSGKLGPPGGSGRWK